MDIKNIETFLRVAELENFTKAAEELSYAQSTVTTQIQQLERELGFPLFDRVGKHVSLTQLGEKFRAHADDILHIWFQACMLGRRKRTSISESAASVVSQTSFTNSRRAEAMAASNASSGKVPPSARSTIPWPTSCMR